MKILREIDNDVVNVVFIEIPATAGAKKLGWSLCIEQRHTYKVTGSLTVTRHYANSLDDVYVDDRPYYKKYTSGNN